MILGANGQPLPPSEVDVETEGKRVSELLEKVKELIPAHSDLLTIAVNLLIGYVFVTDTDITWQHNFNNMMNSINQAMQAAGQNAAANVAARKAIAKANPQVRPS